MIQLFQLSFTLSPEPVARIHSLPGAKATQLISAS